MADRPRGDTTVHDRLRAMGDAEGGPMFMGKPDRWWDGGADGRTKHRCERDHVSTCLLSSEALGKVCMSCFTPCSITFPEDVDGPLLVEAPHA